MGSLTTWGLLGMVIGGAIGGILSDRIGRKKMLIIAVMSTASSPCRKRSRTTWRSLRLSD